MGERYVYYDLVKNEFNVISVLNQNDLILSAYDIEFYIYENTWYAYMY